jgi:hypothetical protein
MNISEVFAFVLTPRFVTTDSSSLLRVSAYSEFNVVVLDLGIQKIRMRCLLRS